MSSNRANSHSGGCTVSWKPDSAATTAALPRPLPNTYWVEPGRLLAGEYPGSRSRLEAMQRLQRLLAAGISYFIDLTEPGELPAYDGLLQTQRTANGRLVMYVRKPIRDHSVPPAPEPMREILECLERALAAGHCVYLHCQAGIGRTGTVLGCHFVQRGLAPADALKHLNELWSANERARLWPQTPETDQQTDFVRYWGAGAQLPSSASGAELAAARPLRNRYHGALQGLAVGDALGTAVQFRRPGSFTPVADLLGGGPFDLPRGAWTDDTAMALCLAESLLECNGFDAADQVRRYRKWQDQGHLSSTGQCVGITAAVSRALATAQWSGKLFAGSHDPSRLDKEPLARVVAAILYFAAEPEEALQQAADAARTTHQSPIVLDTCRYFAALLLGALQGKSKQQLLGRAYSPVPDLWTRRPLKAPVEVIASGSFRHKAPPEIEGGGNILQCLEAALWALHRSNTFRDGALLAVNLGLDADVTGAVYGQLAGALYGVAGIPATWRQALLKRDLLERMADGLLSATLVRMAGPPTA